jgi:DMSO/TMAO reductase YedYZ molybdopterin-dependent catalytic subunit
MNNSLITPNLHRKPSSLRYYQDGPPEAIDIQNWQLQIIGLIPKECTFSYKELLQLPQVEESRRMVCVCNWSIRRTWRGILLSDIIELIGLRNFDSLFLKQTSVGTPEKGTYQATIPLEDAISRRALLVHSVDGEPLPLEQGYPVRLLDFGLYGYKNVKGLSTIEVTDKYELGEWEKRSGYDLNGVIRVKKYWMVDLSAWKFVEQTGEVTAF